MVPTTELPNLRHLSVKMTNRIDQTLNLTTFTFWEFFFKFGLKFEKMFLANFLSQHRLLQCWLHRYRKDSCAIYENRPETETKNNFETKKLSKSPIFEKWLSSPTFSKFLLKYVVCHRLNNHQEKFGAYSVKLPPEMAKKRPEMALFNFLVLEKNEF